MNSRETVFVAVLLTAGTILQYFISLPGLLLTPDVITAFFCLGIIIVRPKVTEAIAIGIAGGFLSMLVPGSILPWANIFSGAAGAAVCWYFMESFREITDMAPFVSAFSSTVASGCVFVAVASAFISATIIARFGDYGAFVFAYLPIVIGTAVLNAIIVLVLVVIHSRLNTKAVA